MFDLGAFLGDALVASLLAFAPRLAWFGLALHLIFESQHAQHVLTLAAAVGLVCSDLFSRVVWVQYFIKVVTIVFTGRACGYSTDEAVLAINALTLNL